MLATVGTTAAANWPRWRGPGDHGSVETGPYPTHLNEAAVRWKVALPGKGCSTPIVWNGRIYLTAPVDSRDAVLAFDLAGRPLWQTPLGEETPGRHRNGSGSNPSAVTDGAGIFVSFKSGAIAAVNLDGSLRWQKNLVEEFGPLKLGWDHGTSPVLTEKEVVIARMHGGESWLAAFDKTTGEIHWKTPRNYETPRENDHGYSTPLVIRHEGREALLVWGADHLTAYDAADGRLLWSCGGFNPDQAANWPAIASPVVVGDVAVVSYGRADRGGLRLHGVRLGGRGDVTATHRLWQREDIGAFVPSPAAYRGRVYILTDRGQVECIDPATGRTVWSEALPRGSRNFYASPLIADGNLYAVREDGTAFVARVDGGFKLLAENQFAERIIASFVPVADALLVRGVENLYCLAAR